MQTYVPFRNAVSRDYPAPVAIAIAKDAQEKYNPITLGWFMRTSHQPPMLAISVGVTRYSLDAIREAKSFVVAMPSSDMKDDAFFFGTRSGRDVDKLAEYGTKVKPATEIDGVLLEDAVANFECILASETLSGDHAIFSGLIVASHMNTDPDVGNLYILSENGQLGGI